MSKIQNPRSEIPNQNYESYGLTSQMRRCAISIPGFNDFAPYEVMDCLQGFTSFP